MDSSHRVTWEMYSTPQKKQFPDSIRGGFVRTTASPDVNTLSKEELRVRNLALSQRVEYLQKELERSRIRSSHHQSDVHYHCKCTQKYESQIKDLQVYLERNRSSELDKVQIMSIFGLKTFDGQEFMSEEQFMLKQLSHKVKLLLKENHRLKQNHTNIQNCTRCQDLNLEIRHLRQERAQVAGCAECDDLLKENSKFKMIINEYKKLQNQNQQNLLRDNRVLRGKLVELQQKLIAQKQSPAVHLGENRQREPVSIDHLKSQLNVELRQFYDTIEQKNNLLSQNLNTLQSRLNEADKSLSHLKFEREVSIQNTMRKSKNVAELSSRIVGDNHNPPIQREESHPLSVPYSQLSHNGGSSRGQHGPIHENQSNVGSTFVIRPANDQRLKIMEERNQRLVGQNNSLTQRLRHKQGQLHQKVERILILQNQLNRSRSLLQQVHMRPSQPNSGSAKKSKDYSSDVKKIREFLVSCNPANFQKFQSDFRQIVNQRNQLVDELQKLRSSKNDKEQVRFLQRSLTETKRKAEEHQSQVFQLQRQNKILREKVSDLEKQIQNIRADEIKSQIEVLEKIKAREPEGFNGLQWQKVVQRCIDQTALQLSNLESEMARQNYLSHSQVKSSGRQKDIVDTSN